MCQHTMWYFLPRPLHLRLERNRPHGFAPKQMESTTLSLVGPVLWTWFETQTQFPQMNDQRLLHCFVGRFGVSASLHSRNGTPKNRTPGNGGAGRGFGLLQTYQTLPTPVVRNRYIRKTHTFLQGGPPPRTKFTLHKHLGTQQVQGPTNSGLS